ncbi:MAG: UDP-N-acetylglucosamine 1-carboxyvinyltransferase [Bacillota bacterium]
MEKFIVAHTEKLEGKVRISGAKNAVLPILAATLLTEERCIIENVPALRDVECMVSILEKLGADITFFRAEERIEIEAKNIDPTANIEEECGEMRASFLIAGALLGRFLEGRVAMPGGCQIGSRPIDLHLKGFHALGVKSKLEHGIVDLLAKRIRGTTIYLDFPSVGATENLMMLATLGKGKTIIENAAAEPEIVDLANCLRSMGADIVGDGGDTIAITGVTSLHGCTHSVIADRIEAGTFMVGVAMLGGDIVLENVQEEHLKPVIAKLSECGVKMESEEDGKTLRVYRKGKLQPLQVKTMPFPGFPTDMQAQFMSLMTIIKGTSIITETVFENRFIHANELQRMGADIRIESRNALIEGVDELTGSKVKATDLRGGAALILSAMKAKGETEIGEIQHIERGYYRIDEKLRALGGCIRKVELE